MNVLEYTNGSTERELVIELDGRGFDPAQICAAAVALADTGLVVESRARSQEDCSCASDDCTGCTWFLPASSPGLPATF